MNKSITLAIIITLALTLTACSGPSKKLSKEEERALRQGAYSLIIIQPAIGADPVAILDREDDNYTIAPAEGVETSRTKGLSRKEALEKADERLPGSGVSMRTVIGTNDSVLGYEVTPPASLTPNDPMNEMELLPNILSIDIGSDSKGERRIRLRVLPVNPNP